MSNDILSENKNCQNYLSSSISDINSEPYLFACIDHPRSLTKTPGPLQVDGATDLLSPPGNNPLPFTCVLCTLTFTSAKLLDSHLRHIHDCLPSAFKCHICDNVCENANDFLVHIETLHSRCHNLQLIIVYKCLTCEYETGCEDDLKKHIETVHIQSPVVACEFCDLSFNDSSNLKNHITLFHSNSSQDYQIYPWLHPDLKMHVDSVNHLQNIPQVDGPNQELYEFSDLPSACSSRSASYSLNQEKQTRKIIEDASLNDYEVTVNNADQNVTIKCSSGFYIQVAKASFVTLEKPTVLSATNVTITVDDVIKTKDMNGLEATKLIHFSFLNEQVSLGGVAVHLHHSTRTIQIQGSQIMPDSTRAALWFLKNVTIVRFKDIAKTKKFAIKTFNDAAAKISKKRAPNSPNLQPNSCQSCNNIFNTQSKPSQCIFCNKFFQKRCIKEHHKECLKLSSSTSLSSAPISPLNISQPKRARLATSIADQEDPHSAVIPGIKSSLSFVPSANAFPRQPTTMSVSPSSPTTLSARVPTFATVSSRSQSPQSLSTPQPVPSITVSGSVFLPPPSTTSASGASLPALSSSSRTLPGLPAVLPLNLGSHVSIRPAVSKKKQKSIPTSSADHNTEILEKELSAAQTKIVMLDSQVKDKDQERAVLYARVKILEEKQNKEILEKYFPHPEAQSTSSSRSSSNQASANPIPQEQSCKTSQACSSPAPPSCSGTGCSAAPSHSCACSCSTPMYILPVGCPGHAHHHAPTVNCQHSGNGPLAAVTNNIESNKKEIENLRNEIIKLKSFLIEINQKSTTLPDASVPSDDQPVEETPTATDDSVTPNNDLNASIATVEEFIDDIYSDPKASSSAHLNCQDLTIQLTT